MLSVPDGRSDRTLINATPIPAEGDAITSVVATMQDLVPLDEIPELSDLPVIFISAYGRDETGRAGARVGRGRLHRQVILADGVGRAGPGGGQTARRARAVRRRRARHRLGAALGDGRRERGCAGVEHP